MVLRKYSPWMALGKDQHYLQLIFGLTKSLPHQCSIYVRPIRRCSRSHHYIFGWALCIGRNRKWIHHQHRKKMSSRDFVHWSGCKSHLKCYPNSDMDGKKYKMLKLSINILGWPRYPTMFTHFYFPQHSSNRIVSWKLRCLQYRPLGRVFQWL